MCTRKQVDDRLKIKVPLLVAHAKRNKCYMKLVKNTYDYMKRHRLNTERIQEWTSYTHLFSWSISPEGGRFWEKLNINYEYIRREL